MNRTFGSLKVRRLWTCRKCPTQAWGESVTVELQDHPGSVDEAIAFRLRRGTLDFPMYWANFGAQGAECPACHKG